MWHEYMQKHPPKLLSSTFTPSLPFYLFLSPHASSASSTVRGARRRTLPPRLPLELWPWRAAAARGRRKRPSGGRCSQRVLWRETVAAGPACAAAGEAGAQAAAGERDRGCGPAGRRRGRGAAAALREDGECAAQRPASGTAGNVRRGPAGRRRAGPRRPCRMAARERRGGGPTGRRLGSGAAVAPQDVGVLA